MKSPFNSFGKANLEATPVADDRPLFEEIFNEYNNTKERIDAISRKLELFAQYISREIISEEEINKIRGSLKNCTEIQTKEEFDLKMTEILKPILEIKNSHPLEYEETRSRASNAELGYIELNRFVTYEKIEGTIQLHHSEAKILVKLTRPRLIVQYNNAMQSLAKIIESDPEIQEIQATSWIVAKTPTLFTNKGFTVEQVQGNSVSSLRDSFKNENRSKEEVATATISREDFLKVFGDKK